MSPARTILKAKKDHSPYPEKLLAFRMSSLGDVVLATGVLKYLHNAGLDISVVTRHEFAPLLENNPHIKTIKGICKKDLRNRPWRNVCKELASEFEGYHLLDLHGTLRSWILKRTWPAPCFSYPKMNLRRRLYKVFKDPISGKALRSTNVPQRYFSALADPPPEGELRPCIFLKENELQKARKRQEDVLGRKPFVCIHPYATHPAKTWSRQKWNQFLQILEKNNLPWLIVGQDNHPLAPGHPHDLTNTTTLRETCALIALSSHLTTSDSGPMHLGTALGIPVTALFGPTSKEWGFYPSGEKDAVIHQGLSCSPCTLHGRIKCPHAYACMEYISPEIVYAKIADRLD